MATYCRKARCVELAGGPGLVAHTVAECRTPKPKPYCRREACVDAAMGPQFVTHRVGECRKMPGNP